jgi:Rps23 Pro-64 3,4-dihydroxylase Tpa1-like proline 4-hydroxylase
LSARDFDAARDSSSAWRSRDEVMEVTSRTRVTIDDRFGYLVLDDLLSEDEHDELHRHAMRDSFFYENAFEWNRVWHPLSGMALLTGPKSFGDTGKPGAKHPTGSPYDRFFGAVERELDLIGEFLGLSADRVKYVMSAYLYRAGWGLPWHEDIGEQSEYTGAFTFYLHKTWRGNWGGELMILADERLDEAAGNSLDLSFTQGTGLQSPSHVNGGMGAFIMPKPNRLVVMRPGVIHSVNPVSPLAGENMRFSLAGFYL